MSRRCRRNGSGKPGPCFEELMHGRLPREAGRAYRQEGEAGHRAWASNPWRQARLRAGSGDARSKRFLVGR
ncbi:hypothetical protein EMIT0373P_10138 [Pseudomonas chlororaphis]